MQQSVYFVYLFVLLLTPSLAFSFSEPAGFYNFRDSSLTPANDSPTQSQDPISSPALEQEMEVEMEPESQPAPQVSNQELTTSSYQAPVEQKPATVKLPQKLKPPVAQKPKPVATVATANYNLSSLGKRAQLGERLSSLKSCGLIRFVNGIKRGNNTRCEEVEIANSFAAQLMKNLPLCMAEGAKAAGKNSKIVSSNIYNAGAYSNRPVYGKKKMSMHSTGRAIDIYQMDMTFADGTKMNVPMMISHKNHPFYKTFNSCWQKKMSTKCGSKGIIDCKDPGHHDHVHLSMPFCPRKAGFAGT